MSLIVNKFDQEKSKIILITYRLEDNLSFRPTEETFFKLIFKAIGIKYEKRIYNKEKTTLFFGKLPCLYVDGSIIQNRNITKFIKTILDTIYNDNFDKLFELVEFIIRKELRNSNELYYFTQRNMKYERSKKIFTRISHFFTKNTHFEKITCDYLNINKNEQKEEIILNILKSYNKLHILLMQNENTQEHLKENFNLIDVYLYSYLNEEKTLFEDIAKPYLENLKNEDKYIFESFYNFYIQFDKFKSKMKFKIKSNEEIDKTITDYSMNFGKSKKNDKKEVELSEFERRSVWKYNLFSVGIFVSIGVLFIFLSKRTEKKNKKK